VLGVLCSQNWPWRALDQPLGPSRLGLGLGLELGPGLGPGLGLALVLVLAQAVLTLLIQSALAQILRT
jgi:hypothetical protein